MKITYDPRYDALYLKLGTYKAQHTIACREETRLEIAKEALFLFAGEREGGNEEY